MITGYSFGTGAHDDPYRIATIEDWILFTKNPQDWDKCFRLVVTIDFDSAMLVPVGSFFGVFDGGGCALRNAVINYKNSDYVGLFGHIDKDGEIHNLGAENIAVTGRDYVGGLVGRNLGAISMCYTTGLVRGNKLVGGLVGWNKGNIEISHSQSIVIGVNGIGGLVGLNDAFITSCYATGDVEGDWNVGGLAGGLDGGIINRCCATGHITGKENIGGLVGEHVMGNVERCYATGAVTGIYNLGKTLGKTKQHIGNK